MLLRGLLRGILLERALLKGVLLREVLLIGSEKNFVKGGFCLLTRLLMLDLTKKIYI